MAPTNGMNGNSGSAPGWKTGNTVNWHKTNSNGTSNGSSRSGPRYRNTSNQYHFHFGGSRPGSGGGNRNTGQGSGNGAGFSRNGHQRHRGTHSPLADPEFFSNADIRNYCEAGRGLFLQLSFELATASEVLHAVLKEVPDAEGQAFGARMRARRVSRRLKKAAEDARDTAKNLAATYAAFQREYDPELAPYRTRRRPSHRRFDFTT
ncbi:plasmid transfer protein TraA [Streptomyces gamaensis]|uniref:Plasmid transfer protein TraA n=1 Tax=Streptomyces gamaensis TaxID=1763542 RepID=A0ABW0YTH2_9ACTN